MVKSFNSALHEEPRNQPAPVIPLKQEESLLAWLQSTGRLVPYESHQYYHETAEEEEVGEIMETLDTYEMPMEEEEDLDI